MTRMNSFAIRTGIESQAQSQASDRDKEIEALGSLKNGHLSMSVEYFFFARSLS